MWTMRTAGSEECPGERPDTSGAHEEVDLAARLGVMCLRLNEKTRRGRETRRPS